jgi:hypothetical protein
LPRFIDDAIVVGLISRDRNSARASLFTQMDRRFEQLEGRLDHIDVRLQEWDDRFTRLEQRISSESEHLYGRMRMLHGELIDRIRLGREGPHGDEPKSPRRRKRLPKR